MATMPTCDIASPGMPKIVVNEHVGLEGALPEPRFLERVLKAVNGQR